MAFLWRWCIVSGLSLLCALLLGATAPVARACSIDGIVSISMNGQLAVPTSGTPTAATMRYWAPFSLLAAAPGDTVRLREDDGKLRATLPATAFNTPFRWSWGDGTVTHAMAPSHRYGGLGWYKVSVSYYWPEHRRWVAFDSAQLQIVPKGDLLRTNFGYYAGRLFLTVLRLLIWGALLGVVMLAFLRRRLLLPRFYPPTAR